MPIREATSTLKRNRAFISSAMTAPMLSREREFEIAKLWREDGAYDVILVLSHNDSPPEAGLGSAVFIHIAQTDERQTLGCIALEPEVMVRLLPALTNKLTIMIE